MGNDDFYPDYDPSDPDYGESMDEIPLTKYSDLDEDDLDLVDLPEFIERDGMTFCGACGELAVPGEEAFDWCDHRTGRDCPYMEDSMFNDDDAEW